MKLDARKAKMKRSCWNLLPERVKIAAVTALKSGLSLNGIPDS